MTNIHHSQRLELPARMHGLEECLTGVTGSVGPTSGWAFQTDLGSAEVLVYDISRGRPVDALKPDTLDLPERARAALNYFIRNPDRDARFQPYFISNLEADPPYREHNEWDFGDVTGRFLEAIALIRLMTGDGSGTDARRG